MNKRYDRPPGAPKKISRNEMQKYGPEFHCQCGDWKYPDADLCEYCWDEQDGWDPLERR